jgi:death-on-curing protein
MIDIKEVLSIHEILIEKFGGGSGVRDMNGLHAAISRPFSTFDTVELYPEPLDKATALVESIVNNHPFVDGNKRTGYVLMRLLLMKQGFDIKASQEEKYSFVIAIASGHYKTEDIRKWIQEHLVSKA